MQIDHLRPGSDLAYETLDEFSLDIERGRIRPTLVSRISHDDIESGILVARHKKNITGVLHFKLYPPEQSDLVQKELKPHLDINTPFPLDLFNTPEFCYYEGNLPLAEIIRMESYSRGAGRPLIERLGQEPIEGIFLKSVSQAIGFYQHMGFYRTGFLAGARFFPIMVRMNHESEYLNKA